MGRTVAELERTMSGAELAEWKEYHRLEPLPDPYWVGAQICASIVNSQRVKGSPARIEDFLPRVVARSAGPKQTTDQMRAALFAAIGGGK